MALTELLPREFKYSSTGILSCIAAAVVVAIGFRAKIYRENLGKMVMTINIANLIYYPIKISGMFFNPPGNIYCRLAMGICRGTMTLSLLTGSFFGHAIYIMTARESAEAFHKSFRYYVLIGGSVSSAIGTAVALSNYTFYLDSEETCVHESFPDEFDATMVLLIMLPTTVCAVLSIIWFLLTSRELIKKGVSSRIIESIGLQIYPAIVIICWLPVFIILLVKQYNGDVSPGVELMLQNFYQLQGFMDALAYVIVPRLRNYFESKQKHMETEITSTHPTGHDGSSSIDSESVFIQ